MVPSFVLFQGNYIRLAWRAQSALQKTKKRGGEPAPATGKPEQADRPADTGGAPEEDSNIKLSREERL